MQLVYLPLRLLYHLKGHLQPQRCRILRFHLFRLHDQTGPVPPDPVRRPLLPALRELPWLLGWLSQASPRNAGRISSSGTYKVVHVQELRSQGTLGFPRTRILLIA